MSIYLLGFEVHIQLSGSSQKKLLPPIGGGEVMYEDKEGDGGGQLLKGRTVLLETCILGNNTEFRSGHCGLLRACTDLSGALLCCAGAERAVGNGLCRVPILEQCFSIEGHVEPL